MTLEIEQAEQAVKDCEAAVADAKAALDDAIAQLEAAKAEEGDLNARIDTSEDENEIESLTDAAARCAHRIKARTASVAAKERVLLETQRALDAATPILTGLVEAANQARADKLSEDLSERIVSDATHYNEVQAEIAATGARSAFATAKQLLEAVQREVGKFEQAKADRRLAAQAWAGMESRRVAEAEWSRERLAREQAAVERDERAKAAAARPEPVERFIGPAPSNAGLTLHDNTD